MSPVQPTGEPLSRSARLDQAITVLLREAPEIEAAAVVSFDGLPMASALPASMDEDRVAAMSAALLSLGERAAQGLGRGELSQVYIEGESGTVFLVSAEDEAVLVAVAAPGAKVGLMLFEVRRAAAKVADVLRTDRADHDVHDAQDVHDEHRAHDAASDVEEHADTVDVPQQSAPELAESLAPSEAGADANTNGWSSYAPGGTVLPGESGGWS